MSFIVEAVGPQTLLQDRGRRGYANLAITTSGAMDRTAHDLANRLVGNDADAATLEAFMGSLTLRATERATVAVTGAAVSVKVNGRERELNTALKLHADDVLSLGSPQQGLRSYVAVRGGFDVEPVLGSRASDPTTGIGPAPVAVDDRLEIGDEPSNPVPLQDVSAALGHRDELVLTGTWGPRADWFTRESQLRFASSRWSVTPEANRVGVRLEGEALEREITGELASEGLVRGAVQVPASGQPLVFSSDHPTTGGYPVIAVVDGACVDQLAQARPGTRVRFELRSLPQL